MANKQMLTRVRILTYDQSIGGEEAALDLVMPLLEKVAAKDSKGKPCVGRVGMGGAGHYVKMIHNGIEHGMMRYSPSP